MRAGIALGSNLGDRFAHLVAARRALEKSVLIVAASPVYQTDPVDCPPGSQPFLNCALEVEPPGSPEELHALTRQIESAQGRQAGSAHHAPRVIDLDLLYCGDAAINTPALRLPHPRLHERRFVLQPLADIRPDLILPGFTQTVAALLMSLRSAEPPLRLFARHWS